MVEFVQWCYFIYLMFAQGFVYIWLRFITLLCLKLLYKIFMLISYFYHYLSIKPTIEIAITHTEWCGMISKCTQYSRKWNIYPVIVCVLCKCSVWLKNRSGSIISFMIEMCCRPLVTISIMKFICSIYNKRYFVTLWCEMWIIGNSIFWFWC